MAMICPMIIETATVPHHILKLYCRKVSLSGQIKTMVFLKAFHVSPTAEKLGEK